MNKRIKLFATILFLLIVSAVNAQNSNFIDWEDTARDETGKPIKNTEIDVMAVLHFGTPTSAPSYTENHKVTTNVQGVFTIQVGNGLVVAGSYNDLPWKKEASFIEIKVNGVFLGTKAFTKPRDYDKYSASGNIPSKTKVGMNNKGTQINPNILPIFQIKLGDKTLKAGEGVSFSGKKPVYTINAEQLNITVEDGLEITGTYPNITIGLKKHYVGEEYLDGIVFYVDETGQHGLVAGQYYESSTWTTFSWEAKQVAKEKGGITYGYEDKKIKPKNFKTIRNTYSSEVGAGWLFTFNMIINDDQFNVIDMGEPSGSISYLSGHKFPTWYVPSINELALLYKEKKAISSLLDLNDEGHILWSSSEGDYVWKGHGDGPDGQNYGKTIAGYSGVKVSLGDDHYVVRGAACLNFYTGKIVTIAKTYDNPFILIRKF